MTSAGDASPRVLVTGTGGPSGVAFMKALVDEPWEIYSADIDPYAAGLYLVDSRHRAIVPRGDSETFVAEIIELCVRERVDVLVPTVDSELLPLAIARTELAEHGVSLVLASEQTLRDCLDKWTLHDRCAGALRVPDTVLVDADFDPAACSLPVIVKPRSGSGSRGVHRVDELEELARLPRDATLLVQEYLPGTEYSLDVLARADGAIIAVVPQSASEGRFRDRGHGPNGPRRVPGADRSAGRAADRADVDRERAGEVDQRRRAGPAGGQPALSRHDVADGRERREHAEAVRAGGIGDRDAERDAAVRGDRDGAVPGRALHGLLRDRGTADRAEQVDA